jgi:hypothetical protein
MVPPLKDQVEILRLKAKLKGHSFGVVECKSENMVVVVVKGTPAMFLMSVGQKENMLISMKVNLSKWAWAWEEGFEGEDVFEKFGEEIFTLTSEKNILKYLDLD